MPGFAPAGFVAHLVPATTKPPMSNTRKGRRRMTPTKRGSSQLGRRLPHPPGPSPFNQGGTERGGALGGASHPMPAFGKATCSQDTAKNVCVHRPPEPTHACFRRSLWSKVGWARASPEGWGGCRGQVVYGSGNPCWSPSSCGSAARRVRQ